MGLAQSILAIHKKTGANYEIIPLPTGAGDPSDLDYDKTRPITIPAQFVAEYDSESDKITGVANGEISPANEEGYIPAIGDTIVIDGNHFTISSVSPNAFAGVISAYTIIAKI